MIPAVEEIIPGIFRLPLPLPGGVDLTHINIYLVRGRSSCLLVDAGWNTPETLDILKKQMDEIGVALSEISRIVITHVHPDHYGLAGQLKQLSAATVAMHELEVPFIESRYVKMDNLLEEISKLLIVHGVPQEVMPQLRSASLKMVEFVTPTSPDIILHGGETISQDDFHFRVIPSPGHSPGHICLYEAERRILFSGDHILPGITPNIGLNPQSGDNPLGDYLASLQEMKKLDVAIALPGHELPFTNFKPRIEQLLRHHRQRNEHILTAMGGTASTAGAIAGGMVWGSKEKQRRWPDLNPWDKRMAVMETLAHLVQMQAEGRVEQFTRDGLIYFRPVTKGDG
jgi:glyoxylase-like metal-dependent hydrolase (beta-lactamase superfamily II)